MLISARVQSGSLVGIDEGDKVGFMDGSPVVGLKEGAEVVGLALGTSVGLIEGL